MQSIIVKNEITAPFVKLKEFVWCLILFGFCSNTAWGSTLLLFIFPFLISKLFYRKIFDNSFLLTLTSLFLFSISFAMMTFFYKFGTSNEIIKIIVYPMCLFILGNLLVEQDYFYKKTYKYLYLIIISSTLFGFLSIYKTIITYGSMSNANLSIGRAVVGIWSGRIMSATGLNSYISLGLCLFPLLILSKKISISKRVKFLNLLVFLMCLFTTVQLANRTGLLLIFISFLVIFAITKKTIKQFTYLASTTALVCLLFLKNFLGVKSWWEGTLLYNRILRDSVSGDPRVDAWMRSFWGLFKYPVGGRKVDIVVGYSHNMWLDVGRDGGLLPFLLILLFTIFSTISLMSFIKSDGHPPYLKCLVAAMYTAFYVTFFVEPVIQGLIDYFTFFCFVAGIVQRLNYNHRQEQKRITQTNYRKGSFNA